MALEFMRSYQIDLASPPPMAWETYSKIINQAWQKLLSETPSETEVQHFLELHPCMIPGPFGLIGTSGHSPFPAAVITQPVLPDFTRRIPDFLWIARDSMSIYPVLIEIEAPSKRWFNSNGQQTSHLTQALGQISEWKVWFGNPRNVSGFIEHYQVDVRSAQLRPLYVLIYGRREEANHTRELAQLRATLGRDDEFLMTYDRLQPQYHARDFITARVRRTGYEAVTIPPTISLGPMLAKSRALISSKVKALDNSPYLSEERRLFLASRFNYWDDWSQNGNFMHTGDRE